MTVRQAEKINPKLCTSLSERDHYGNAWRVTGNGRLEVDTPDGETVVAWDRPDAVVQSLATDEHGFVWLIAGGEVYFCNPRAIADSEPPDQSENEPGSPGVFTVVDRDQLPGTPTELQCSEAGLMLVHCANNGPEAVVEVGVTGRDIGGPFTSGHTTEVRVSLDITPGNPDWEVLSARLPCGTHDNFCTTADGRVFLAGGATHYRGYPAVNHVYDTLLACEPGRDTEWSVVGRLPGGCIYPGLASLDGLVYVLGGGGGGALSDTCWTFDATSTSETTSDLQSIPSLPSPRFGSVACAAGGRIWVVGGTGGGEKRGPLRELISFAPGESEWRVEPPAPIDLPVATLSGCELNEVIYLLGGAPARFLAFNTATGTWDASLPNHPLGSQASAMTAHNGEVWVCGGGVTIGDDVNPERRGDQRVYSRKSHSFAVSDNRWTERANMPCEQNWGAACSLNGRLLLIAGAHRSQSAGAYVFDNRVLALRQ